MNAASIAGLPHIQRALLNWHRAQGMHAPWRESGDPYEVLVAAVMGTLLPLTMHRLGRDPAVGSSVLITAITDSMGFFIFLGLATLFLL